MDSESILHWLIVFGVLVGIVFIIRRAVSAPAISPGSAAAKHYEVPNSEKLRTPMKWLETSLIVVVCSLVLLIALLIGDRPSGTVGPIEILAVLTFLVMIFAGLCFFISLGILAKRLGRSWIVWVGLTMLTNPFGAFVSYYWMKHLVNKVVAPSNEQRDLFY